jgi:hypothetical protein
MSRLIAPLAALALFIGLGFVTRPLFREWLETNIKESEAASKKEMSNWKAFEPKFQEIKFDKPITTQFDMGNANGRSNPVRR